MFVNHLDALQLYSSAILVRMLSFCLRYTGMWPVHVREILTDLWPVFQHEERPLVEQVAPPANFFLHVGIG